MARTRAHLFNCVTVLDCVNTCLFYTYIVLLCWGVAVLVTLGTNPNTEWPIIYALIYILLIGALHFGLIVVGRSLVPDYVFYPVSPWWLYMIADAILLVSIVGILISYSLNPWSSFVAIIGTYAITLVLVLNIYKLCTLSYRASEKGSQGV